MHRGYDFYLQRSTLTQSNFAGIELAVFKGPRSTLRKPLKEVRATNLGLKENLTEVSNAKASSFL